MRKLFKGYWKTKQAEAALNDRKAELDKEDQGFMARFEDKAGTTIRNLLDSGQRPGHFRR